MFKRIYFNPRSKKIHLWEIYNGKTSKLREDFEYVYYLRDKRSTGNLRDIHGYPVSEFRTKDKKHLQNISSSNIPTYESDIHEEILFLQQRYRDVDLKANINDFNIAFTDIEIESDVFPKPDEAKYPINLITIISSKTGTTYTWGNRPYTGNSKLVQNYYYIPDEKRMLESFVKWFRKQRFDIITGWYVKDFDIQYILNRLDFHNIEKTLSPLDKFHHVNKKDKYGKNKYYCRIAGLNILDYLELYQKFTFNMLDSYTLNAVSMYEKIGGKIDLEGQINSIFKTDWNKFVEYNIQDVVLVVKMEEKKKFIELAIQFSSKALIPLEKVFSSIATVEGYIMRLLHQNDMVMSDKQHGKVDVWKKLGLYNCNGHIQNMPDDSEKKIFDDFFVKGAYVMAKPGLYNDVCSFDVESLYPHNIMMFNISPEVKVFNPSSERIAKGDLIKSPVNGVYYLRNQKGIIPIVIEKIFNERKMYKQKMFEALKNGDKLLGAYYNSQQHIRKILINSFYGCLANEHSHFYDVDNARVITRAGRVLIKYLSVCTNRYFKEEWHKIANKYFPDVDKCIPIKDDLVKVVDTDSNYVCFEELKKIYAPNMPLIDFMYKMEKEVLNPFYDKVLEIWTKKYNAPQLINFKREGIINRQFVLAKKKYITQILQNEDEIYDTPKIKATGVEIVKSDTPSFCRQGVKDIVKFMFEGEKPDKTYILKKLREAKRQFKKQKIEDISFNKTVNEYTKYAQSIDTYVKHGNLYFKKATPIHVRSSMNYNYMVHKFNLFYLRIDNKTKIKYLFVNNKNLLGTNVIGYIGNWPEEFNRYFKVDYTYLFEKSFLGIIQRMFDVLNWGTINLKAGGLEKFSKKRKV